METARIVKPIESVRVFENLADAKEYRSVTGCGGWIFAESGEGRAFLFSLNLTPSAIFLHPMTRGREGTCHA